MFCSQYLCCCDNLVPLDVQQSQDVVGICVNMLETRGHSTLLVAAERARPLYQSSSAIKT